VWDVEPLFLGNHVALDFLNTAFSPEAEPVELIGDGPSFLEWLVRSGLLTGVGASRLKHRLSAEDLHGAAAEARGMRGWATSWISRWTRAPKGDYEAELRRLNGWLRVGGYHREVVSGRGGLELVERCNVNGADDLLALVATEIARLVTTEDAGLVRRCAGPACTLWFVDRTKGHSRLFCSASICGNRAKVAAFRARQKRAE